MGEGRDLGAAVGQEVAVRRANRVLLGEIALQGDIRSDFLSMFSAAERWLCNDTFETERFCWRVQRLSLATFLREWDTETRPRSGPVFMAHNAAVSAYLPDSTWASGWRSAIDEDATTHIAVAVESLQPREWGPLPARGANAHFTRVRQDLWSLHTVEAGVDIPSTIFVKAGYRPFRVTCNRAPSGGFTMR